MHISNINTVLRNWNVPPAATEFSYLSQSHTSQTFLPREEKSFSTVEACLMDRWALSDDPFTLPPPSEQLLWSFDYSSTTGHSAQDSCMLVEKTQHQNPQNGSQRLYESMGCYQCDHQSAIEKYLSEKPVIEPLLIDLPDLIRKSLGRTLKGSLSLYTDLEENWQQLVITLHSGLEHPDERTQWENSLFARLVENEQWIAALEFVTISQA